MIILIMVFLCWLIIALIMPYRQKEQRVNLHGWADGLDGYKKIEFPLQMAMYEVAGDCDWSFDIKTKGDTGLVYDPWTIDVVATRCCSCGYKNGILEDKTINEYSFSFVVPQYTLKCVYEEAIEAIKKAKIRNSKRRSENVS